MSMTSARGAEKPSGELSLMKCVFSAGVIHHCNRPIIGCFLHKLCIQIQQQASNSLSSFAGVLYCQTPTRLPIQYPSHFSFFFSTSIIHHYEHELNHFYQCPCQLFQRRHSTITLIRKSYLKRQIVSFTPKRSGVRNPLGTFLLFCCIIPYLPKNGRAQRSLPNQRASIETPTNYLLSFLCRLTHDAALN